MTDWKLAGYVHVESGNVMINDIPESEIDQALSKMTKAVRENDYSMIGAVYDNFVESTDGMGTIINGFGGDGSYPIYILLDEHGLTVEARIMFREGTL